MTTDVDGVVVASKAKRTETESAAGRPAWGRRVDLDGVVLGTSVVENDMLRVCFTCYTDVVYRQLRMCGLLQYFAASFMNSSPPKKVSYIKHKLLH